MDFGERQEAAVYRLFADLFSGLKPCFLMFRGLLSPPIDSLMEAGVKPGSSILDYGCGPGEYAIAAAKLVGDNGKVYALDSHLSAINRVQKLAIRKGLNNIKTILSDGKTGLHNASIDIVLLHKVGYAYMALQELHRVLRSDGALYFRDYQIHTRDDEIISSLTDTGLFSLSSRRLKTFNKVALVH